MIRKLPWQNKYRLYSKSSGRTLGTFRTKAEATKREKQILFFKRFKK